MYFILNTICTIYYMLNNTKIDINTSDIILSLKLTSQTFCSTIFNIDSIIKHLISTKLNKMCFSYQALYT